MFLESTLTSSFPGGITYVFSEHDNIMRIKTSNIIKQHTAEE